MKKNYVFALMSAIALTSAVSFTACSSDDAVVENNPTYDGKAVRTDFAFNITKASQGTRMKAANVQEEATPFLGMKDMYLFPFKGEPSASNKTSIQANYPLGELTGLSDAKSSQVYSLTIPVGTDNFLFYARANNTGTNFEKGKLNSTLIPADAAAATTAANVNDIDGISFGLQSIQTSLGDDATNIAAYLTQIANTTGWKETVTTAATDGNYQALARLYTNFTANYPARSGSAESVRRMVLDLFKSARAINQESSISGVSTLAGKICDNIDKEYNGVRVTVGATNADPEQWTATAKGFNATFPANLNLPVGAAQLQWDDVTDPTNPKFIYIDNPNYAASTSYQASTDLDKYCYPAELLYFDNSPLRATDQYKKASDFPVTVSTWDALYQADTWADKKVKPTTRAVAMTNNVNYGVALLVTNVRFADMALEDNMKGIAGGDENQTITADADAGDDKNNFYVTGLLIGGQAESVDWNMVNPDDDFDNVIYDNDITFKGTPIKTTASANNYTVVLDNYTNDANGQKPVLIALEIKNGNKDFYGINGVIPAGNTFYLVGQLVLSQSTNNWSGTGAAQASRPATYRITNENVKRMFVQDYKTIANITISKDALQNAYSTIPDLRSTEILFGLSVDLTWQSGLEFNLEM